MGYARLDVRQDIFAINRRDARKRAAENANGKEDVQVWITRFKAVAEKYGLDEEIKLNQLLPRVGAKLLSSYMGKHLSKFFAIMANWSPRWITASPLLNGAIFRGET